MIDNGPPPWLKIVPDSEAQPARADTLRMNEAFDRAREQPEPDATSPEPSSGPSEP